MKYVRKAISLAIWTCLILGCVYLFFRWKPVWEDAGCFVEQVDLNKLDFEGTFNLNKTFYSRENAKGISYLMQLLGVSETDMRSIDIRGTRENRSLDLSFAVHSSKEPLLNLYLAPHTSLLNGAQLYNSIRHRIVNGNTTLDHLVPLWTDHEYLTFDQLIQLFDADLTFFEKAAPKQLLPSVTRFPVFLLLVTLKHEGNTYTKNLRGADLVFTFDRDAKDPRVSLQIIGNDPETAIEDFRNSVGNLLPFTIPDINLSGIDSLDITISNSKTTLKNPEDNIVDQSTIDALSVIKTFLLQLIKNY